MGFFKRLFGINFENEFDPTKPDKHIEGGLYKKLFHSSRDELIKKFNADIEKDMNDLKKHVQDFNNKLALVRQFLKTLKRKDLEMVKREAQSIERLVIDESRAEKEEKKFVMKAIYTIGDALEQEEVENIEDEERELYSDIRELKSDLENLEPCLVRQLDFLNMDEASQMKSLKNFLSDINEEAKIIGYEEDILKEIRKGIDKLQIESIIAEDEQKD